MKKNSNTLALLFQQRNISAMNLQKRLPSVSNFIILTLILAFSTKLQAQVGIASTTITPNASAMLEVQATNKGFLPPRMTDTQRGNIATPAEGLIVYQTNGTKGYYYYNGSAWVLLGSNITFSTGLTNASGTVTVNTSQNISTLSNLTSDGLVTTTGGTGALSVISKLPIANGGTNATTKAAAFDSLSPMIASGDIIYGGNNGKGTRLIKGSDGQFLALSSGLPAWQTKLPIANGGTNAITKTAAFDSLSPMIAQGDIIYGGAAGTGTRLLKGDSGKVLTMGTSVPSWQTPASSSGSGSLIKVTYLTSTTQLTNQSLDANTTAILVKMVGGGGAGAGVNGAASAAGGGGGAGGYLEKYITGISSSTKYSFNCGAGGTGVSAADGNNGDSTQFTILSVSYKAGGGKGGKYLAGGGKTSAMGGAGGTSVNGNINAGGAPGGWTWVRNGEQASSGAGGSSPFGGGGIGIAYTDNVAGSSVGYAANGNGAGGGGACNGTTATARAGGNGSPGLIIIYEYR